MLTQEEYLDKTRFPVTNNQTLSLEKQMMLDSFNLDELTEWMERGGVPNEKQSAALKELQFKAKNRPALPTYQAK